MIKYMQNRLGNKKLMSKVYLLRYFIIIMPIASCNKQYKKVMNELKDGQLNRRYILPTNPDVMKSFYSNPTKENMKKVLKVEGMKNADEYVDKVFLQTTLMFKFLKKHPEISKLERQKKQELIRKLIFD